MNHDLDTNMQTAKEIVGRLRRRFESKLERVIFFGSRVNGTSNPYSDYDFLLVLPQRDHTLIDQIDGITTDYELEHGIDVSLEVYSRDAFLHRQSLGTPFIRNVLKTGIDL